MLDNVAAAYEDRVENTITTGMALLEPIIIVIFGALVLLLVAVLVPGIGTQVNGAQRWIRFGSISLQPSELGRILLPIMAAKR